MADYVNNKEFLALILEYRNTKSLKSYNKLGGIFLEICTRTYYKPNFVNYSSDIKEDATSDGCFAMTKALQLDKFDETRGGEYPNPFAYFTQIAHFAMIQNINKLHIREDRTLSLDFIDNFNENGIGTENENYKVDSQIMVEMSRLFEGI
jgi:glutamine amidotransferase-like uncharacterized protein